ncbi:1-acyl-sn-glycerol-3-phosphate acyltransferase [bacterium AH-315-C07]|nr:1-acyl-sn-glycerol-3-phosphate acyltransferase [bacterium AH-315-C07]
MPIIRFIRYFINGVSLAISSVIFFIIGTLGFFLNQEFKTSIFRSWARIFFRFLGTNEHIHGNTDALPERYILISNHPSGVELVWLTWRFKVVPLAKQEILKWFLIGGIAKAAGAVFVKREDNASRTYALKSCEEAIAAGKNILVFPEGGCKGKDLSPFLPGAFHLSKQTNVPILPVYVRYEDEEIYEWGDIGVFQFIWQVLIYPRNRSAHLYVYDPISPDQFSTAGEFKEFMSDFYLKLQTELKS